MSNTVRWTYSSPTHRNPRDPMPSCDCDATPEDIAAGIHGPGCTSTTGPADEPSDHYGQ
ncbi:hypothetical protein ACFYQT_40325 [Streptomyces tibetensis]|uniref:Uncharacterized protein n=1 Tax=Streptomyces tibetensis TaxID=2382123 RepID=A0ABW6N922_9ACTN